MPEEFISSVQNLTTSEDRQSLRSQLACIPDDFLLTVRGMYDPMCRTLTLLSVKSFRAFDYSLYRHSGGKDVYVEAKLYKELNQC